MLRILGVVLLFVVGGLGCGSIVTGDQPASATQVSLHVDGMMCAESCAKTVESVLAAQPGVEIVAVDFEQARVTCKVDPQTFDVESAVAELADKGFTAAAQ